MRRRAIYLNDKELEETFAACSEIKFASIDEEKCEILNSVQTKMILEMIKRGLARVETN